MLAQLALLALAQDAGKVEYPPLDLAGEVVDFALRPVVGGGFLLTEEGGLYRNHGLGLWHRVETPGDARDRFACIAFFDAKRGVIVGSIGEARRHVLRTENGGSTWRQVLLPARLEAVDLFVTPQSGWGWSEPADPPTPLLGCGWIVAANGEVFRTGDFGRSWEVLARPPAHIVRGQSVCFTSEMRGFLGGQPAALCATEDAGRSWSGVPVPDPTGTLEDLSEIGGVLVAQYETACYWRPLEKPNAWSEFRLQGHPVIAVAEDYEGGFLAVRDDLHGAFLSPDLDPVWTFPQPLVARPLWMWSLSKGRSARILLADGSVVNLGRQPGVYPAREADLGSRGIRDLDRDRSGRLWGFSGFDLYWTPHAEWTEKPPTWHRFTTMPWGDRGALYTSASGNTALLSNAPPVFVDRPGEGVDVLSEWPPAGVAGFSRTHTSLARSGDLWVVARNETRNGRLVHATDQIRAGAPYTGHLLASPDAGRSWNEIETYEGRHIEALDLRSNGDLSLVLAGNHFVRGEIRFDDDPRLEAREEVHFGHGASIGWSHYIVFLDADHGWIGGCTYFDGARLYETTDGGKTWCEATPPDEPSISIHRLGGALARIVRPQLEIAQVDTWKDGAFVPSRRFDERPKGVKVCADGSLLLRFESGRIWSLTPDGERWARLHDLRPPPRRGE